MNRATCTARFARDFGEGSSVRRAYRRCKAKSFGRKLDRTNLAGTGKVRKSAGAGSGAPALGAPTVWQISVSCPTSTNVAITARDELGDQIDVAPKKRAPPDGRAVQHAGYARAGTNQAGGRRLLPAIALAKSSAQQKTAADHRDSSRAFLRGPMRGCLFSF